MFSQRTKRLLSKCAIWQHHCLTHVGVLYCKKYFVFFPWVLEFVFLTLFLCVFHCLACSQKFLSKGVYLKKSYFRLCFQDQNLGVFNIHIILIAILLISSIALFIPFLRIQFFCVIYFLLYYAASINFLTWNLLMLQQKQVLPLFSSCVRRKMTTSAFISGDKLSVAFNVCVDTTLPQIPSGQSLHILST